MSSHKAVITGMGVVSPLGCDLNVFWKRLCDGVSGIRAISLFDASAMDTRIAGEVVEFDVDKFISKKEQRRMDPFCYFALAAAKMAIENSVLNFDVEDLYRCGTIVGSGIGGLQTLETQHKILLERGPSRCSPFM